MEYPDEVDVTIHKTLLGDLTASNAVHPRLDMIFRAHYDVQEIRIDGRCWQRSRDYVLAQTDQPGAPSTTRMVTFQRAVSSG